MKDVDPALLLQLRSCSKETLSVMASCKLLQLTDAHSGRFEYDASLYMPLEDFKNLYSEYRKQNGYDKEVKWTKDHYDTVFQETGVVIKSDTLEYGGTRMSSFSSRAWTCRGWSQLQQGDA